MLQITRRQRNSFQHIGLMLVVLLLVQNLLPLMGHGIKRAVDAQTSAQAFVVVEQSDADLQLAICGMPLSQMGFGSGWLAYNPSLPVESGQLTNICPACLWYQMASFALLAESGIGFLAEYLRPIRAAVSSAPIIDLLSYLQLVIRGPPSR